VSERTFASALERSATKALPDQPIERDRLERYLSALHMTDLALACACADGHESAWDHFVLEYRPVLYRAADALDPSGGARELADGIYADLFGLVEKDGQRRSLFRYFHGRSSLATWLRAVLAQRQVDRVRATRRLTSIDDTEGESHGRVGTPAAVGAVAQAAEPDPERPRFAALVRVALLRALALLADRDRLRLSFYYREGLTLAQIGGVLKEHEATVSRQLARTRKVIRSEVERYLRAEAGLGETEVAECFACTIDDPGTLDLGQLFGQAGARKNPVPERSS
jgi:RNA polymerase sigma-70 factor (ECF subfamily)